MPNRGEQSVRCGGCGMALEDAPFLPMKDRTPCPSCGSKSRDIRAATSENVKVSGHLSHLHERMGRAIGFGEDPRDGRSTAATLESDTRLKFSVSGSSPQGEEDTLAACRVLAQRLRQDDAAWSEPEPAAGQVDCVIHYGGNQPSTLNIQVVRAVVDPNLWWTLGVTGAVSRDVSADEAANLIRAAIELKCSVRKIPTADRQAVALALDSTRLPGVAFDMVVDQFRTAHGAWVKELGFFAVWLVGPTPRLVWRLDGSAASERVRPL